jgi:hypothetical protein
MFIEQVSNFESESGDESDIIIDLNKSSDTLNQSSLTSNNIINNHDSNNDEENSNHIDNDSTNIGNIPSDKRCATPSCSKVKKNN